MISGNFRTNIIVRIAVICLLMSAFLLAVIKTGWVLTTAILFGIVCLLVADLIRYTDSTNRAFKDFLLSIKNADFTSYSDKDRRGKSFSKLNQAFNTIIAEFRSARLEQESNYAFLQLVVNNINTAIIAFDSAGNLTLINEAFRTLFDMPFLSNISQLQKINPQLYQYLSDNVNDIGYVNTHSSRLKLLFRTTSFTLQGQRHRLTLMTDVRPEIDRNETDAWEQLLRVLTHEIMNSITPIASLSGTISGGLSKLTSGEDNSDLSIQDMSEGLRVIEKRSNGLVAFVNNYKTLVSLPNPDLKRVGILPLFERIGLLVAPALKGRHIQLKTSISSELLFIVADEGMIEQVLLNLIYNAAEAVAGTASPEIELSAALQDEKTIIKVADNGAGISPDILDKIFIPFFTTRNTGTGIGLSLSRQIMRLHNGHIDVYTALGSGTTFTLSFA